MSNENFHLCELNPQGLVDLLGTPACGETGTLRLQDPPLTGKFVTSERKQRVAVRIHP